MAGSSSAASTAPASNKQQQLAAAHGRLSAQVGEAARGRGRGAKRSVRSGAGGGRACRGWRQAGVDRAPGW
ncbi:hypothetical protein ACFOPN_15115 [Xanthomonas hyacinthi]|uniref:hypothetical protein n=1 Tax=Xanthomonas hyacinthi TaxID=56455 RepID=UPI003610583D